MTIKEASLQKALRHAGLRDLPRPIKPGDNRIWINAIVLVRKANIENYCIAVNDGTGKPKFSIDFGPCMIISAIEEIYPITTMDSKYMPDLRSDRQIIEYLSNNGYDPNIITQMLDKASHATPEEAKRDRDVVKTYVTKAAMNYALKVLAEREKFSNYKQ